MEGLRDGEMERCSDGVMEKWRDGGMEAWKDGEMASDIVGSNSKIFDLLLSICARHFLFFRDFVVLQTSTRLLQ